MPPPDLIDHYEISWYAEDEPGLKTATPIKTAFDVNESNFEPAVPSDFTSTVPLDLKHQHLLTRNTLTRYQILNRQYLQNLHQQYL